ncbi:MAG: PilZ domain-containing protein [Thermodesulfobacteriota bacterium]
MANKDTIFTPEKRLYKRILAPIGTTALIKNSSGYMDTLYVKDISVVGILANGFISTEKYPINTLIDGILLNVPPCELSAYRRISLIINEGKVIHSLIDKVSKTVCYGIEFTNDSSYVKEILAGLANKI